MLLLDAGVWVAAKDGRDRYCEPARALAIDSDQPVGALDLTLYEVANVVGARKGRTEEATDLCRLICARSNGQLIAVDAELIRRAVEIAAEHGLTAYDAAYVAAARRHRWTLVSTDVADLVSKGLAVTPDPANYP
ncbi:MAG TPA: PIN domain-containing protein [Solirubrobacterales bacterium]|nr:PIN domain-containing protein [Solirubrobacterales bacterium]